MSAAPPKLVLRIPRPSAPSSPFVAASAVAHALALASLFVLPAMRGASPIPDDALVVDLVAAPAPAGPPAAPEPSLVAPAPEPEGARLETRDVEPVPDKPPEKEKPERPKPKPPPPPRPDAGDSRAAQGPPGSTGAATGTGPVGASVTSLDLGALEQAWYRDSVIAALQSRWVRPVLEGTSRTLEVTVAFDISRDGTVQNLRIDVPSGVPSLDRSALRAVAEASPLPPLPPGWREPVVPARFMFRWHPSEP